MDMIGAFQNDNVRYPLTKSTFELYCTVLLVISTTPRSPNDPLQCDWYRIPFSLLRYGILFAQEAAVQLAELLDAWNIHTFAHTQTRQV